MAINKKNLALAVAALAALLLLAAAPAAASVKLAPRRSLKNNNNQNNNNNPINQLGAPTIECVGSTETTVTLEICATGEEGAPKGVKVLFEPLDAFVGQGGWPCAGENANPDLCTAKLTSSIEAGACTAVVLGAPAQGLIYKPQGCDAPLDCAVDFIARAFALGGAAFNASDFSSTVSCPTLACPTPSDCTTDEDCRLGLVCVEGECLECGEDADCGLNQICSEENECICDCPTDWTCVQNTQTCVPPIDECTPACLENQECVDQQCVCDCPFGWTCEIETQTCVPPVNPPGVCFNNDGDVCGLCVDVNEEGGRGCDASLNQALVCTAYGVSLDVCVISAVQGGGAACGPTTICCAVVQPGTISPDVNGICPIFPPGGDLFPAVRKAGAGAVKKP